MSNIVQIEFKGKNKAVAMSSLYRYDYGQILEFSDLTDLPEKFEVHFSNSTDGKSKTMLGENNRVDIPDEYLRTGRNVYGWIYLHTNGDEDGETVYVFTIKVKNRATPSDQELDEDQSDAFMKMMEYLEQAAAEIETLSNFRAEAETLPAGSEATGSYSSGLFHFGIPQGIKGDRGEAGPRGVKGDTGDRGETGATPNLTIGTVETLEPTEDATATITGDAENPVLNLGIPQGEQGDVSMAQLYSILPTDEASGAIASFPDGADNVPMPSLKVTLEPIQSGSGTPSPDNIRPISGRAEVVSQRTGKNLIPYPFRDGDRTIDGITWTMNSDGKLNAHGTSSRTSYYGMYGINSTSLSVLVPLESIGLQGGDTVTLSSNYSQYVTVQCNKEDGTLVSMGLSLDGGGSVTKMLPTTAKYVYIGLRVLNGTSINQDNIFVQLEKGSTATDYEPYQGDTYTTDLGQTVYGGTLDVVTGELVVDRAMVTLDGSSDEAWVFNDSYGGFRTYLEDANIDGIPQEQLLSSSFIGNAQRGVYHAGKQGVLLTYTATSGVDVKFVFFTTGTTDISLWRTWLESNPTQLVYPLATPQTYQLTPQEVRTLLGTNNVWSDGDVSVTYKADVALYVDKKLNASGSGE